MKKTLNFIKKNYKKAIFLCVLFMVSALFCSCSSEYDELDGRVEKIIECTVENDAQGVFSLVDNTVINSEKMDKYFPKMHEMLGNADIYFVQRVYVDSTMSEGVGAIEARYFAYTKGGGVYEIKVREVDGFDGFVEFSAFELIGDNSDDITSSAKSLCTLLYTFACIGFCAWMIVDCLRRFVKKKPVVCGLLCALIIFGVSVRFIFGSGGFALMPGVTFGFMPSEIFTVSKLSRLELVIPAGAIVYFAIRKKIWKKIEENSSYAVSGEAQNNTENQEE